MRRAFDENAYRERADDTPDHAFADRKPGPGFFVLIGYRPEPDGPAPTSCVQPRRYERPIADGLRETRQNIERMKERNSK